MKNFRHLTGSFLNAPGTRKKGASTDEPRQATEMQDATLETASPPQPTLEHPQSGHRDGAPGVPVSVQRRVLAWALEELAALRLNPLDRDQAKAGFAALNAKSRDIYVYQIANRSAQLLEKPVHAGESASNKRRALVYLAFFRAVCRSLPATPPFQLALAVGDELEQRVDMPVFASRKQRGEATIQLPDIDFLNHDFYAAAIYDDTRDYRSKLARAASAGIDQRRRGVAEPIRCVRG